MTVAPLLVAEQLPDSNPVTKAAPDFVQPLAKPQGPHPPLPLPPALARAWALPVLPLAVAGVVKAHDVFAGMLLDQPAIGDQEPVAYDPEAWYEDGDGTYAADPADQR